MSYAVVELFRGRGVASMNSTNRGVENPIADGVNKVAAFGNSADRRVGREEDSHRSDEVRRDRAAPGSGDQESSPLRLGASGPSSTELNVPRMLSRLSDAIGKDHFGRYFDRQARFELHAGTLDVTVPSDFLVKLIERRFGGAIRRTACEVSGKDVEVRFHADRQAFGFAPIAPVAPGPTLSPAGKVIVPPAKNQSSRVAVPSRPKTGLLLRHKLSEFMVGTSNRLAYAAAIRVAEDPTFSGSIFIHSECGMGKTHLLQGLAIRFLEIHPAASVRYTTAETFTNEYVMAIKANKMDAFRKQYRKLDLLCVDDVHFFSRKEATQGELLHTFDAIGLEGARVVLASDEHPREIATLSERLRSRFMAGAVVKIDAPDADLRPRLIRHLASRRGLTLEDAAVALLSERTSRSIGTLGGFGGSVREIDGLLIQVEAVYRLLPEFASTDGHIGAILVRKALGLADGERGSARARKPITIHAISSEVCKALSVEVSELMGKGRHKRVVLARALTAHLCRKLTNHSFPEIARGMGRPNHSTVITACKRLAQQISVNERVEEDVTLGLSPELRGLDVAQLVDAMGERVVRVAG